MAQLLAVHLGHPSRAIKWSTVVDTPNIHHYCHNDKLRFCFMFPHCSVHLKHAISWQLDLNLHMWADNEIKMSPALQWVSKAVTSVCVDASSTTEDR